MTREHEDQLTQERALVYWPTGLLGRCLDSITNPRRHRWNRYLRACKKIPKDSPVYGSTSFQKINDRRHEIIREMLPRGRRKEMKETPEYMALEDCAAAWACGQLTASRFIMRRQFQALCKKHPEMLTELRKLEGKP